VGRPFFLEEGLDNNLDRDYAQVIRNCKKILSWMEGSSVQASSQLFCLMHYYVSLCARQRAEAERVLQNSLDFLSVCKLMALPVDMVNTVIEILSSLVGLSQARGVTPDVVSGLFRPLLLGTWANQVKDFIDNQIHMNNVDTLPNEYSNIVELKYRKIVELHSNSELICVQCGEAITHSSMCFVKGRHGQSEFLRLCMLCADASSPANLASKRQSFASLLDVCGTYTLAEDELLLNSIAATAQTHSDLHSVMSGLLVEAKAQGQRAANDVANASRSQADENSVWMR